MELMEALSRHLSEDDAQGVGARTGKDGSQRFGGQNSLMEGMEQVILPQLTSVCSCTQILIVDDIDMNRYILKQIFLSKFNLQCDEAINGREAVEAVKARAYQECCSSYKIIIMDYEMPIMNGIEASKKIKKY